MLWTTASGRAGSHVEHWDHDAPPAGVPCPAGTEHVLTFGPDYKLGGFLGVLDGKRAARRRLAELLGLAPADVTVTNLSLGASGDLDGFRLHLPEAGPHGYHRLTYSSDRVWTYSDQPVPWCWWRDAAAVDLPRAPVGEVLAAAAEIILNPARAGSTPP